MGKWQILNFFEINNSSSAESFVYALVVGAIVFFVSVLVLLHFLDSFGGLGWLVSFVFALIIGIFIGTKVFEKKQKELRPVRF